ncbi:GNAT family N-acetyltransferase [Aspergillus luchuensis]|uniref:GNAT family N-acetyltransferase n=1 Tax=Aspergillus kawachii TaxID=1069201 RepID=A0A146FYK7_ASPKA|nr:GNAT family N-acetyltransferase [Aspergillus luchuensis]
MTANQTLRLLRVHDDPLITWLRPRAPAWTKYNIELCNWQYRRVQRAVAEGIVLQSGPIYQIARCFPPRPSEPCLVGPDVKGSVAKESWSEGGDEDKDAGVVALLFPPRRHQKWTLEKLVLQFKLVLLDIFCARRESGTDVQVCSESRPDSRDEI